MNFLSLKSNRSGNTMDNTYNELLKEPFYEFHEKRIKEDIEREGDLDNLYEGLE